MDLLKNTREYRDFAGFIEDSGGDVRHLEGPVRKPADVPSNAQQHGKPGSNSKPGRASSRGNSRTRAGSIPRAEKGAKSSQKSTI